MWSHSLLYKGYRDFPGGKKRPGCDSESSSPSSAVVMKGRAIPILPLWAVRPAQRLSALTSVNFNFTFSDLTFNEVNQVHVAQIFGNIGINVIAIWKEYHVYYFRTNALGNLRNIRWNSELGQLQQQIPRQKLSDICLTVHHGYK